MTTIELSSGKDACFQALALERQQPASHTTKLGLDRIELKYENAETFRRQFDFNEVASIHAAADFYYLDDICDGLCSGNKRRRRQV